MTQTPPPFTAVLFDLDGTIVDSAPGILSSIVWTHEQLRMPVPPRAELLAWVGPPLLDSFRDLARLDEDAARHAVAIYREHYRATGLLDTVAFPGMVELLRAVHAAGVPLSLATSKPESSALTILGNLGVTDAFTVITGDTEDGARSAKADVVAEALRRLAAGGAELSRPVMVGDRIHDVEGAAVHGVPTIHVTWGYGTPAEAAGAVALADTAAQLRAQLGL